jgi:hypothetical protein
MKLVFPLFLYFLFFVSMAGEVKVHLPFLKLGVEPLLSEVGVALLSCDWSRAAVLAPVIIQIITP